MNPIIEKVALAILDSGEGCLSGAAYVDPHKSARAAIRATLEGLRDNVSEGIDTASSMEEARLLQGHKRFFLQAIAELDA